MHSDFSRPGKPTDNAHAESFKGTLRAECQDVHWIETLIEARQVIECWRREYMTVVLTGLWENERRAGRAATESQHSTSVFVTGASVATPGRGVEAQGWRRILYS